MVDLAAEVTGARYAALGVIGPDGEISEFITTGLSADERARIGALPRGRGILGALIEDERPLRLDRIGDDPRSVGFPPAHPPMTTFLGAPVIALGRVFGNIYLTDKGDGRPFTQQDEDNVVVLATQAGVAVANASLYEDSQRQARMLDGLRTVSEALLEDTPTSEVVRLVCERALELAKADVAAVVTPAGPGGLVVSAAAGAVQPGFLGLSVPETGSVSGEVMRTGATRVIEDASRDSLVFRPMADLGNMGHSAFLPLGVRDHAFGTLAIARLVGGTAFTQEQLQLARTFADQASIALEYGRVRQEAERLAILDERERIAKELHDGIIQSLFAVGMSLQGAAARLEDTVAAERIDVAVGEIDRVIRDLRNYIFGLRPGILADRQLDQALRQLAEDLGERTGMVVEVKIDADLAARLSGRATDIVQMTREALSNIARHAVARRAALSLARKGTRALLTVSDDGRGFDPDAAGPGQGLKNLRARVAGLGGTIEVTSAPGKGCRVKISLPV